MSILSGLGKFGLGNLEEQNLYEKEKEKVVQENKPVEVKVPEESDFLYEKKYVCPVCGEEISTLTVRAGKVHVKKVDTDLRLVYE